MSEVQSGRDTALPRALALLMVDVEGSTRLWQADVVAAETAMTRYAGLVAEVVTRHGGWLPPDQGEGDGRFAAFEDPAAGVAVALALQQELAAERWPTGSPLRVRMGIHAGPVVDRGGLLLGEPVHRCARICACGHGGQVLVSAAAKVLVADRLPPNASLRDLGEYRLRDLPDPERIFQLEHPELPSQFPALRALHASRTQLPVPLDTFVGREREIAEVGELLDSRRIVTLTGPGGSGKTRLATHLARELARDDPTGVGRQVVLMDLAPLADTRLLAERLAAAFGVRMSPDSPVAETIAVVLAGQPVLLVADNCEHLMTAGPLLAELVGQAEGVRVLATSRQPLGVPGEQEYPVLPLAVSVSNEGPASVSPAVRLFVDRAKAVQPDFELGPGNAATIEAICRRLDGLPLAIELAAPWMRTLGPDGLLNQLVRPLELLHQPGSDRADRHGTLRAAIDWSYQQLSSDEQKLLLVLAVFAGGADLDAVTRVCGDELANPVLDVVASLASKNLTQPLTGSGQPRFGLLETLREFGAERLRAGPDEGAVRARHAVYFADVAEQIGRFGEGPEGLYWVGRARTEADNLRTAIDFLMQTGDGAAALQVVIDCESLWWDCGYVDEGLERLLAALAVAPGDAVARGMAHIAVGWLAHSQGREDEAMEHVQRGLALARAQEDLLLEAWGMQALGKCLEADHVPSCEAMRDAIQLAEKCLGLPVRYAVSAPAAVAGGAAHHLTGQMMWRDLREARRWSEQQVEWSEREGYLPLILDSRIGLALVLLRMGDLAGAQSRLASVDEMSQGMDVPIYRGALLIGRLELAHRRGDLVTAERAGRELLRHSREMGIFDWRVMNAVRLVDVLVDGERLDEAVEVLRDAGQPRQQPTFSWPALLVRQARLARLYGRPEDAQALLDQAEADLDPEELRPERVIWYVESAYAAIHRGATDAADELLDRLAQHVGRVGLVLPPVEQQRLDEVAKEASRGHRG